jgi:hypothetical protein
MPQPEPQVEELSWRIREFAERGVPWKILIPLGLVSVGIAASLVLLTDNYFGGAIFVLLPLVLLAGMMRSPQMVEGVIDEKGVSINGHRYPFKRIKYFAFLENELVIQPKRHGSLHIPLHEGDEQAIQERLLAHIPQEEHEESLSELAARFLRIR